MAQITKTVDKTSVNGSEVFIYTINAAYSGLTIPNQEGEIIDIFPSKIKYILPPIGGQIQSITETPVSEGTQVTFHLGTVNSGTSLSFTIACHFDGGRVEGDSYTNHADLVANGVVIMQATAPTVNLTLDENFQLTKFALPSNVVHAGDEVTFVLSLNNNDDPGAAISNVVITDILPPQLTPVTTFQPVGQDFPSGYYSDSATTGLTGTWEGNTLIFPLPQYHGMHYDITFKATVSANVTPGETFENIATWTVDGKARQDAPLTLSIYDPTAAGFALFKHGTRTTMIGAPMDYELQNHNAGNVTLSNYELEDVIPSEIDITACSVEASSGLVNYGIYVALASAPDQYLPVATDIANGSFPHTQLAPWIPAEDRLAKIKLTAQNLLTTDSQHSLFIHGKTNATAEEGGVFKNRAVATSGSITQDSTSTTTVTKVSELAVDKIFSPVKPSYDALEEFHVILTGKGINTVVFDPIFADLMPAGLRYVVDSEYVLYYEKSTGITYDSRQPGFPVPMPEREVIPDFSDTGNTLLRWKFSDFILPTFCQVQIVFKVFVEINAPSSFVNKGYLGVAEENLFWVYDEVIDTLDVDGDGSKLDRVSCKEARGVALATSEFFLEKFVKGQHDLAYSTSGFTVQGGDIAYRLQITNNQPMDLQNIEIVDILPYVGDTGVILTAQQRGSQFEVTATSAVTAQIINVIGEPVDPNPDIIIEYSTSNNPQRFDELGNPIGSGAWDVLPPADITTLRAIKVTTAPTITLHPYERLMIDLGAKAPVGAPVGAIGYNSYAVRANKITSSGTEPLLPTEPNKVEITIAGNGQGSIGNLVWLDDNQNGIYDQGELGINDVTVELYDDKGTLLKTTVTSNHANGSPGYYLFTDLPDGIYQVKFKPFGEDALTIQRSDLPNGSKPDSTTGLTAFITMSNSQQILEIDAGLSQGKPPVIHAENQCVHVGDVYDPLTGVTATDYKGTDITDSIVVVSNTVDTSTPGVYTVTYRATDKRGKTTTKTIQVVVCQNSKRQQAITDMLESVALEQTALSHILNAEGEKIQKAKALQLCGEEILEINQSVNDMMQAVTQLEMILQSKLRLFEDGVCNADCCDIK